MAGDIGPEGAGEDVIGSGGLPPTAVVIEVSIDADCASDHVELLDRKVFGFFEEAFHDAADFEGAAAVEASGVGVTVDRRTVCEVVILSDGDGTAPTNVVTFDGVTVGMGADSAAARVT